MLALRQRRAQAARRPFPARGRRRRRRDLRRPLEDVDFDFRFFARFAAERRFRVIRRRRGGHDRDFRRFQVDREGERPGRAGFPAHGATEGFRLFGRGGVGFGGKRFCLGHLDAPFSRHRFRDRDKFPRRFSGHGRVDVDRDRVERVGGGAGELGRAVGFRARFRHRQRGRSLGGCREHGRSQREEQGEQPCARNPLRFSRHVPTHPGHVLPPLPTAHEGRAPGSDPRPAHRAAAVPATPTAAHDTPALFECKREPLVQGRHHVPARPRVASVILLGSCNVATEGNDP